MSENWWTSIWTEWTAREKKRSEAEEEIVGRKAEEESEEAEDICQFPSVQHQDMAETHNMTLMEVLPPYCSFLNPTEEKRSSVELRNKVTMEIKM